MKLGIADWLRDDDHPVEPHDKATVEKIHEKLPFLNGEDSYLIHWLRENGNGYMSVDTTCGEKGRENSHLDKLWWECHEGI